MSRKNILIISKGQPFVGGASTTVYNLKKKLGFTNNVLLIYLNTKELEKIDPNEIGDVYQIVNKFPRVKFYPKLKNKIINLIRGKEIRDRFTFFSDKQSRRIDILHQFFYYFKINFLLRNKNFKPDLIISNLPHHYALINNIGAFRKILIVNGSTEMGRLAQIGCDSAAFVQNPRLVEKIPAPFYEFKRLNIIFNSPLTKSIYEKLNVELDFNQTRFVNIVPKTNLDIIPFDQRKIDVAFIVSQFNRKVKNAELAYKIFFNLKIQKKICIGSGENRFSELENCEVFPIMEQSALFELMVNTKLIIVPSYFDSSPGIVAEANALGCNVLVSKNVGWHELIENESVINDFNSVDEWCSRAKFLIQYHIKNSRYVDMVNKAYLKEIELGEMFY
jgi:glycosyltransferase involved in cell wall biosynthesis